MKTVNVVFLVAILACVPLLPLFAVSSLEKLPEKPLKDMTVEELLNKLGTGPNQTEAFDMFILKFQAMCPQIDKYCMMYRGYGLQDGLMLNFTPLPTPDLVVVPLGPAIMAQLNAKGVLVSDVKGDMMKSNLMQYDIVTAVGDTEVADTGGFYKALAACPPDKEVELKIIRGGKAMSIKGLIAKILEPKPPIPPEPINPPPPPPPPPDNP